MGSGVPSVRAPPSRVFIPDLALQRQFPQNHKRGAT
jgi:hypothetical protein